MKYERLEIEVVKLADVGFMCSSWEGINVPVNSSGTFTGGLYFNKPFSYGDCISVSSVSAGVFHCAPFEFTLQVGDEYMHDSEIGTFTCSFQYR